MITTRYGQMEGIEREHDIAYLGIPYAAPPVGENRWKAPQPLTPWEGVLQADHFRSRSMQPTDREKGFYDKEFRDEEQYLTVPDEDSLYLNIWTPKDAAGKKLPVAFWIHGGAFMTGSGFEKEFDGEAYARRDIILVTINYRLNIWGFLAHPWLSAESEHHVSGNYGILDQIAALRWVHENIAAFGGDPENITVFGQSAGAMSTQTLVSSPLTESLIARAIMQSGGGYRVGLNRDDMTLEKAEGYGEVLTRLAGVQDIEALRAMPAGQIMALMGPFMQEVFPLSHGLFLVPVVDGVVLPHSYSAAIEQGTIRDIPYLLGSTKDDIMTSPEQKAEGKKPPLQIGCEAFAEARSAMGGRPVYVYHFIRDLPGDDAGAFHSSELWYTFGTLHRAWRPYTEHDDELSEEMLGYWSQFIRTGDPNGEGLENWAPYTKEAPCVRVFG